jgi:tetratricopeptide (TPR) repeat protein
MSSKFCWRDPRGKRENKPIKFGPKPLFGGVAVPLIYSAEPNLRIDPQPASGGTLALVVRVWLLIAVGIRALAQDPRASMAADYRTGEQALRRGDLVSAEKAFRHVLETAPNDVGAHANLGVIYMRGREWQRALQELKTGERLAPQLAGIRLNIGMVHYRKGTYAEAIPAFESVVRDEPGSVQARHLLGLCYFFEERYVDAVGALEKLWPLSDTDLDYLYVLTIAAGKAGRHDLETKASERLLEVGKDSAELHLFLGRAFLGRGQDDQALAELKHAEKLNPRLPFVHYNLGLAYKRQHDFARAKREFLMDRDIEPDVAYDYDELGTVSAALGETGEAERYFREAVKRDARLGTSWYGLAKIYKEQKKYSEALNALEAAGTTDPKSASVHYLKAQVMLTQGKREEARDELAVVRKLQKETTDKLEREISGGMYRDPQLGVEK